MPCCRVDTASSRESAAPCTPCRLRRRGRPGRPGGVRGAARTSCALSRRSCCWLVRPACPHSKEQRRENADTCRRMPNGELQRKDRFSTGERMCAHTTQLSRVKRGARALTFLVSADRLQWARAGQLGAAHAGSCPILTPSHRTIRHHHGYIISPRPTPPIALTRGAGTSRAPGTAAAVRWRAARPAAAGTGTPLVLDEAAGSWRWSLPSCIISQLDDYKIRDTGQRWSAAGRGVEVGRDGVKSTAAQSRSACVRACVVWGGVVWCAPQAVLRRRDKGECKRVNGCAMCCQACRVWRWAALLLPWP